MTSPALPPDVIASRLAAWRKTGDPAALWPEVSPPDRRWAHRRIAAVTSAILTDAMARPALTTEGESQARALGVAAYVSGMGALLGYWIEQGDVDADARVAPLLAEHLDHGRRRAAARDTQIARILEAFGREGLTPVVLKGAHTAARYFADPGVRPTADIDLLVPPEHHHRAGAALRSCGFEQLSASSPVETEWSLTGASRQIHSLEIDHASNPWAVDLHTSLDKPYFRGVTATFGDLPFTESTPWSLAGSDARVLRQPLLTAHLAQHTAYTISELRLIRLVELSFVIRQDTRSGDLNWKALSSLLRTHALGRFAYPAFELVERLVPGTVDQDFLRPLRREATSRMRSVIEQLASNGMRLGGRGSLSERLMWARGPVELVRNLADLVWPRADTMAERARKYRKWSGMLLRGRWSMRS